ncbi:MAG: DNA replication terminus site-binding protein [Amphritea sp.]|nr:DNA replication terminus site-binding protein [Amphritea sp.]
MLRSNSATELLESLEQLQHSLLKFCTQLQNSRLPYWLPSDTYGQLDQAAQLFGDIWYRDNQDGRTTISQYGLIGADPTLIALAEQTNTCKQQFQTLASQYRLSENSELQESLQRRSDELNQLLNRQGASRLHLKQCYRLIPIADPRPEKIGFSWYTSGRSIRKLTPAEAEEKLMKMDVSQTHIRMQLDALGKLQPGDMLAQIQTQVPVMRANLVWKQDKQTIRKARNTSLPILIALNDDNPTLPAYNEPPTTPPEARSRLERSDLKIDPQPFLPSLRVHRYNG